AN
ncbi:MAG: molybdopterin synthase catalytic subunit MoaE, partial [Porphyrobacter sp. HL-46]